MRGGDQPFTTEDMNEQIKVYNGREHTTTRHPPNKMTQKLESRFVERQQEKAKTIENYPFKVDDMVRLLKHKPNGNILRLFNRTFTIFYTWIQIKITPIQWNIIWIMMRTLPEIQD
jgi:hypothetical protein